jgi:uncharacterized protein (TIGR02466 family)
VATVAPALEAPVAAQQAGGYAILRIAGQAQRFPPVPGDPIRRAIRSAAVANVPGSIEFTEERVELFPTRFFRRRYDGLDGFNRRMKEIILEKEAASEGAGITRSNVGGWHSNSDLLRWGNPEIKILVELLQSTVLEYVGAELRRDPSTFDVVMSLEAWANVSRNGHYSRPHMHPLSNFAVVYYVDMGDKVEGDALGGTIEFLDPRSRVTMLSTPGVDARDSVGVRPTASTMLIFPAWIYHYVHPYRGQSPRISIAANITVRQVKDKPKVERPSALIIEDTDDTTPTRSRVNP